MGTARAHLLHPLPECGVLLPGLVLGRLLQHCTGHTSHKITLTLLGELTLTVCGVAAMQACVHPSSHPASLQRGGRLLHGLPHTQGQHLAQDVDLCQVSLRPSEGCPTFLRASWLPASRTLCSLLCSSR